MSGAADFTSSVPELEEAVLGAVLVAGDALAQVSGILRAEMFYADKHKEIYQALTALHARGEGIDILTVTEELRERGTLEKVGGPYYIAQLGGRVAGPGHLWYHANIIREYHLRRRLVLGLNTLLAEGMSPVNDVYDVLGGLHGLWESLLDDAPWQENLKEMPEVVALSVAQMERRREKAGQGITGIPTGLPDLDYKTGGLQNGELTVLAGRPGDGKTAFSLHIAKTAAKAGYQVLIFSLEMSASRLGDRLMLSECNIDPYAWKHGRLSQADLEECRRTEQIVKQWPIAIDDKPYISMDEICATARLRRSKGLCDLVIVDYMGLCNVASPGRTREQEVAACSRSAKNLAKQLDCPVMMLSQLNRQSESRAAQIPQLSDLRESGAIEQDADLVLLLYRPARVGITTDKVTRYPTEGMGICIVAKQRNGETGDVYFGHNPSMTKFGEFVPPNGWMCRQGRG